MTDSPKSDTPSGSIEEEGEQPRQKDDDHDDHHLNGRDIHVSKGIDGVPDDIEHGLLVGAKEDLRQVLYQYTDTNGTEQRNMPGSIEESQLHFQSCKLRLPVLFSRRQKTLYLIGKEIKQLSPQKHTFFLQLT